MAGRLFDRLEQEAFKAGIQARTKESMGWFKDRVSNIKVSRTKLISDGPSRSRQVYGNMYNFQFILFYLAMTGDSELEKRKIPSVQYARKVNPCRIFSLTISGLASVICSPQGIFLVLANFKIF